MYDELFGSLYAFRHLPLAELQRKAFTSHTSQALDSDTLAANGQSVEAAPMP